MLCVLQKVKLIKYKLIWIQLFIKSSLSALRKCYLDAADALFLSHRMRQEFIFRAVICLYKWKPVYSVFKFIHIQAELIVCSSFSNSLYHLSIALRCRSSFYVWHFLKTIQKVISWTINPAIVILNPDRMNIVFQLKLMTATLWGDELQEKHSYL